MANVEHIRPQLGADFWGCTPSQPRAQALRRLERRQRAAIRRARALLTRRTLGGDEAVLARMQGIAREYEKYHSALIAIIRTELL